MACQKPLQAFRAATGGPVFFSKPNDGHYYQPIEIPCGYCILCRTEQARQWAARITHEAQLHDESCFVTLTYDDQHLPEHGSLDYSHLQLFWKRLRKAIAPKRVRYYAVGEYGDKSLRPHYHACIFGHAFIADRIILRSEPYLLWTSPLLQEAWGLGHVSVGALNPSTASYTASYVLKQQARGKRYCRIDPDTGELVAVVQPRAFMSRRPGLGNGWYELYSRNTYDNDHIVINGSLGKPPRYYDNKLRGQHPDRYERIKDSRRKNATRLTNDALHARARYAHARAARSQKSV
jgi:hypothetical protein